MGDAAQHVVRYTKVESGRGDVDRYAAFLHEENAVEEKPLSIQKWMTMVSSNSPEGILAASDLSDIIASCPYESILFEAPGTTLQSSNEDQFEFALVNQPNLKAFAEGNPDRHAFEEYFNSESCSSSENDGGSDPIRVCAFPNLGKDATLISPLPQIGINDATYSHLASFIRNAPKEQVAQFWRQSARAFIDELKHKHERINEYAGTWFSTNGMGVAWLHLRIDSLPKYYSYVPFTKQ